LAYREFGRTHRAGQSSGAQLSILRDPSGRELLWDGNPAFWNGRAPLLFPIVGTLAGGRTPRAEDAGDTDQRLIERVSTLAGNKAILLLEATPVAMPKGVMRRQARYCSTLQR
jgi:hypothetical protein